MFGEELFLSFLSILKSSFFASPFSLLLFLMTFLLLQLALFDFLSVGFHILLSLLFFPALLLLLLSLLPFLFFLLLHLLLL